MATEANLANEAESITEESRKNFQVPGVHAVKAALARHLEHGNIQVMSSIHCLVTHTLPS